MRLLRGALLAGLLAAPLRAQPQGAVAPPQIIDLNLVEALVAVRRPELGGIFAFVPAEHAPLALADYLIQDRRALKLFLKKGRKDFEEVQGVNEWDKKVLLYLVGMASGPLPPGIKPVPKKVVKEIGALSLAQPLPLQIMTQRRAERKR